MPSIVDLVANLAAAEQALANAQAALKANPPKRGDTVHLAVKIAAVDSFANTVDVFVPDAGGGVKMSIQTFYEALVGGAPLAAAPGEIQRGDRVVCTQPATVTRIDPDGTALVEYDNGDVYTLGCDADDYQRWLRLDLLKKVG